MSVLGYAVETAAFAVGIRLLSTVVGGPFPFRSSADIWGQLVTALVVGAGISLLRRTD